MTDKKFQEAQQQFYKSKLGKKEYYDFETDKEVFSAHKMFEYLKKSDAQESKKIRIFVDDKEQQQFFSHELTQPDSEKVKQQLSTSPILLPSGQLWVEIGAFAQ